MNDPIGLSTIIEASSIGVRQSSEQVSSPVSPKELKAGIAPASRKRSEKWVPQPLKKEPESSFGCPYDCQYCNQQFMAGNSEEVEAYLTTTIDGGISINDKLMAGNVVTHRIDHETLMDELQDYPYYVPQSSVILQNFTDPSLNWMESLDLAENLVDRFGHEGPIVYITKGKISDRAIERIKSLQAKGANIMITVTYGGLPKAIEPVGEARVETIKRLKANNIPVIMSMRPMVIGINADEPTITKVMREAGKYADAVTVGGLFVDSIVLENFKDAGYPLDTIYETDGTTESKVLPPWIREMVRSVCEKESIQVPVFDHNSCAIAYLNTTRYNNPKPDRLAHWARTDELFAECAPCPKIQQMVCRAICEQDHDLAARETEHILRRLGFSNRVIPGRQGTLLVEGGRLHLSQQFIPEEEVGLHVTNAAPRHFLEATIQAAASEHNILIDDDNVIWKPIGQDGWEVTIRVEKGSVAPVQKMLFRRTRSDLIRVETI